MPDTTLLQHGDLMPHFTVVTVQGDTFSYGAIWQHKNLALVTLPAVAAYPHPSDRADAFCERKSVCVVTRDALAGVPSPGALIADKWGEIVHVAAPGRSDELPTLSELLEWLEYVERRCPECEGRRSRHPRAVGRQAHLC